MLIHDASYHVAVQLEGPEVDIAFPYFFFLAVSCLYCKFFPSIVMFSIFLTEDEAIECNWHHNDLHVRSLVPTQDSLLSILRMVLVPSPSVNSDDISNSVISGAVYDNAMVGDRSSHTTCF